MDLERLSEMDESQLSNPPASDTESSDSDDGAGAETHAVEWLATTRARRSTAGNRMKSMLANEEPDSDLELLFAEEENDEGFSDADEAASDVQMDLSSDADDDDEEGGGDGDGRDDLSGEKELERQAREKQAAQRKRRAQDAIPAKFRKKKKVRIDARVSEASTPAPRPRKKSERISWLPLPADQPTRASSRETTRMSKEQLHQQMVEREEKRLRQLAQMQKKAARMAALKKPPMTQEERLREAAVVEKRNSKSLNRWEVAERQREEERREKLAALHRRTLRGAVITFWSGIGEARRCVVEEEERPKRRREKAKAKEEGAAVAPLNQQAPHTTTSAEEQQTTADNHARKQDEQEQDEDRPRLMAMPPQAPPCVGVCDKKPSGVLAAPVLAPPPTLTAPRPSSNVLAAPNTTQPPPTTTARFALPEDVEAIQTEPAKAAESSRNAIVLHNFDADAIRDKSIQVQILFGRKMNKLPKPPPSAVCAITNLPARYRDPKTGLPFHNAHAYRELQRLKRGEHRWSRILNAWVGSGSVAARGVPERFLNPGAGSRTEEEKEDEHGNEHGEEAKGDEARQSALPQVS